MTEDTFGCIKTDLLVGNLCKGRVSCGIVDFQFLDHFIKLAAILFGEVIPDLGEPPTHL